MKGVNALRHLGDITKISGRDALASNVKYKVYMYTFPNGKVYIGMTKNSIQNRKHCGYQHNDELKSAIRAYGWKQIRVSILAENLSESDACEKEILFIQEYEATNPEKGYNKSFGGKSTYSGLKHSDEYKNRMSKLMTGRKVSEQTIMRQKAVNAKNAFPAIQLDAQGNSIRKFASLSDAAKYVNGHKTNIKRACLSHKLYKGYMWMFESEVI